MPLWLCFASALPVGFGWAMAAGRGHRLTAGTPFHFGHGPRFVRMRQAARPVADSKPIGPRETWRHHLWFRMPLGLGVGLAMALLLAPVAAWDVGFGLAARIALVATLWTGLLSGPVSNVAVATALTALHLHVTEGTPVRLLPFLEDARRRNLLRVIGPVYQFRHARLQERLARQPE
ncbi:hypothetical protein J2Z21_001603 [Streptomyces griseochromogenes]|uniref:Uncharacterized protein n=1 Tax=Streptomyces griseochromogenes TaxID=68214 RepID=A0ABS4LMR1_9ACTN|nr:hypothetical protein [Streptomyces griseochromogenes]MBP2048678.1 hypothetical protein [Streptomyces griseochromogenes]